MPSRKRPEALRLAAAARLEQEACCPVADLVGLAVHLGGDGDPRPSAAVMARWIEWGRKSGGRHVYLDGYWCTARVTYVSSREALARFAAEAKAAAARGGSQAA